MKYQINPHTLSITAPNGTVTTYPDLFTLGQAHSALETAERRRREGDGKQQKRDERRQAEQ